MYVYSECSMDGKALVTFVALAIKMELNRMMHSSDDLKSRSMQEVIDEIKLPRSTFIKGRRKPFNTKPTKLKKVVMRAFGISEDLDIRFKESADDDEIRTDSKS